MSPATSAAAVSTPGVLIHQSTWTLRPLPPAHLRRLLPSGTARPLRVATVRRRLPVTAQSAANPGYLPESEFYKIQAILRPWRVPHVSSGLLEMGIRGVTVWDVRGFGAQGGSTERHGDENILHSCTIDQLR